MMLLRKTLSLSFEFSREKAPDPAPVRQVPERFYTVIVREEGALSILFLARA